MKQSRFYARSGHNQRIYPLDMVSGETLKIEIDWGQLLGERETTIVDTSFETFGSIGAATPDVDGSVTSAFITADSIGYATVRNRVTLANDEILTRDWRVHITDPTNAILIGDYRDGVSP